MIKFGTGGWRAVIGDEFTKANLRILTAGLCEMLSEDGLAGEEICVGYDRRFLSKESAHWIAEVLSGYGFRTFMVNRSSPTPLIMFEVRDRALSYGMMVTASHNPAIYNGVKIFTAGGKDAAPEITSRIESFFPKLDPEKIPVVDYDEALARGLIIEENPTNAYIDTILSMVDTDKIAKAQLRIGLDPMYGVSQSVLRTILTTCRCDLEVIHDSHDTLFGGKLPAPNADTLGALAYLVKESNLDFGIATDGDADRIGIIDDKGNYLHPNDLLVLLYYYLVHYRGMAGPCVRNNSTTHLLDRIAEGMGQKCYEVPVGFKYISAKMAETGAIIGGESSGGLTVIGHIRGKDGIYAAALITEMVAVTGKSISALYEEICGQYVRLYYADSDCRLTQDAKAALKEKLFGSDFVPDFGKQVEKVSREDGLKVWFTDGSWTICRFSGTEPLLRLAAEAYNPNESQRLLDVWKEVSVSTRSDD